ncbi:pyridoxamine 5'-phosphate oxidase family protein [Actinomadura luteofluorescens]|uniref:Nitroimidazol reductase NimA-like FMN-containing flavoprotein (Pyridoxamine 5'-phosphate oxidase superfamily) n=1 Tax=Actinomadura luteofluorescens TaxID=46163 RepID=A0A7Y9JE36_9ACTN|nr:pyridoxamine 5'-phosphate oxidase family protein [Actinomadura luteofluorescens]NYD45051.1 nitroimidazol reductase NimA-like FMN-containing flavoprotein (pyridoxamine 5'-phosphate oxidase superfamily) [Actinomadura luteofluorescens]
MRSADEAAGLTRAECLRLMGTAAVGRIVFTRQALPAVAPVGFVVDGEDVVIPVPRGSGLVTATRGAIVAFQADDLDAADRIGWSVTVVGRARVVRDPGDRAREALRPWTAGTGAEFILVSCGRISGQRVGVVMAGDRETAA